MSAGKLRARGLRTLGTMLISEAKEFVGKIVELTYNDRTGKPVVETAEVYEVNFVPLYGPCMITDIGDIRLDRIVSVIDTATLRRAAG